MGCGSSNAGSIPSGSAIASRPSSAPLSLNLVKRTITSALSRPGSGRKALSADLKARDKQNQLVDDRNGLRGGSATSERSVDSGIGGDTQLAGLKSSAEHSSSTINKPSLDMIGEDGKPRLDETQVIEKLRAEGLIGPSTNAAKGGLTFEVPLGELQRPTRRRPPPRLQKLERLDQLNFTRENLNKKLAHAEALRKKREKEKLIRNRDKDTKNLEIKLALLKIEKNKEQNIINEKLNGNLINETLKKEELIPTVVANSDDVDMLAIKSL